MALLIASIAAIGSHVIVFGSQRRLMLEAGYASDAGPAQSEVFALLRTYLVGTALMFGAYVVVLLLARVKLSRAAFALAIATPIVVGFGLLADRPFLSVDVLSYIAHGAVSLSELPGNAHTVPPEAVRATPIGRDLLALGWNPAPRPSPYGPLWTLVEELVVRYGGGIGGAILIFKVIGLVSVVFSGILVWLILGVVWPANRATGTLAFLWNPVVLVELIGEGHNDGIALTFTLLSIYSAVRLRAASSIVSAAIGALVKYLSLLFVLAEAVLLWRSRAGTRAFLRPALLGLAVSALVAVVLFAQIWVGPPTLDPVRASGQAGPWATLSGAIYRAIDAAGLPIPPGAATTLFLGGLFAAYVAYRSLRVRDARSLVDSVARIAVVYVVIAAIFWPWYTVLPIALLCLTPNGAFLGTVLMLSLTARLAAALEGLKPEYYPFPMATMSYDPPGLALLSLSTLGVLASFMVFAAPSVASWIRSRRRAPLPGVDSRVEGSA